MVNFKPENFPVEDCKVCGDINEWVEKVKASSTFDTNDDAKKSVEKDEDPYQPYPSPLDSSTLGQSTWNFLHVSLKISYYCAVKKYLLSRQCPYTIQRIHPFKIRKI